MTLPIIGAKNPPPVAVTDEHGKKYEIPQVAAATISDQVVNQIVARLVPIIVTSVCRNILERLKDRCSFKGVNGPCNISRAAHDAVHHDFAEAQ